MGKGSFISSRKEYEVEVYSPRSVVSIKGNLIHVVQFTEFNDRDEDEQKVFTFSSRKLL